MICSLCNDTPCEATVLVLDRLDGEHRELELCLCGECEAGLVAEDWIEAVGTPAEV